MEELRAESLDGDTVPEVALERPAVGFLEAFDAIAHNAPVENLLIDVGKQDASGEFGKVGILFDQRPGIQDDRAAQALLADFCADGAAKLPFDTVLVEAEIQTNDGELNTALEFAAIPKHALAVLSADDHKRVLLGVRRRLRGFLTHAGALGPIKDVALGDLVESLPHQFLLNHVLHILDVNEGAIAAADTSGYRASDLYGAFSVFLGGEKRLATGNFDLAFVPRHDGAVAADQADGDRRRGRMIARDLAGLSGAFGGPFKNEALGNVVRVIFDESLFNEQGKVVFGKLEAMAIPDVVEEACGDGMGDICNKRAILLVKDVLFLAREEKVREGGTDFVGDVGEVKLPLVSGAARNDDLGKRGLERGVAECFAPGEAGLLIKWRGGQALQREVFCERDVAEHGEFSGWSFVSPGERGIWEKHLSLKLAYMPRVRHLTQGRGRIFSDIR